MHTSRVTEYITNSFRARPPVTVAVAQQTTLATLQE